MCIYMSVTRLLTRNSYPRIHVSLIYFDISRSLQIAPIQVVAQCLYWSYHNALRSRILVPNLAESLVLIHALISLILLLALIPTILLAVILIRCNDMFRVLLASNIPPAILFWKLAQLPTLAHNVCVTN